MMNGDEEATACMRVLGQVGGVGEVWKIATTDGPRIVVDASEVDMSLHPGTVRAVGEMLTSTPEHELVQVAVDIPACIARALLVLDVPTVRAIGAVLATL